MHVIPTIHAFALPDKRNIISTLYHLRGAGIQHVIFPVPWRLSRPRRDVITSHLTPWIVAAREQGLTPILDIGPWLDVGLPAWALPDDLLTADPRARVDALRAWWQHVRDTLSPPHILIRRRPPAPSLGIPEQAWDDLLSVWKGATLWDVSLWPRVDVRHLEWQEWESDREWWARVEQVNGPTVWVQPWWVQPGRQAQLPTPETVHDNLGRGFVQALVTTLIARGVKQMIWSPLRAGLAWQELPVPGWGTSLDGGAALRAWGETTATWHALRRAILQARALHLAQTSPSKETPLAVQGEVDLLATHHHSLGTLLILRRLPPGETPVSWPVPETSRRVETALTGPGGWVFPLNWQLAHEMGRLLTTTADVIWREVGEAHEIWVLDVSRGADWVGRVRGEIAYQTGVEITRQGDLWWVHFPAGQQGQVVWQRGNLRLQVIGVDEWMADHLWPAGAADDLPLFLGPDRILTVHTERDHTTLRVSTTRPTGLVAVDTHPWRLRVAESGKESVWGTRAGMGGVRLGGPKEWGAPRVPIPDLAWETIPWDGPRLGAWDEILAPREVHLPPGWHWFQVEVPPNLQEMRLRVQGVCDVWLGDERVTGVRAAEAPRERRILLPPRRGILPLTLILWAPPLPWDASRTWGGILHVETAVPEPWRYRAGIRGLLHQGSEVRFSGQGGEPAPAPAAFYLHRARFSLDVPESVWVHLGLALGEIGELAWVFLNGHLVGQWWAGRSRELALWLPWDFLRLSEENELALLHWPRARPMEPVQATLLQLCRERVSTVEWTRG